MDKAMHNNDPTSESPDSPETPEIDAQQQLLADFEQLKAAVAQMQEERLRERAELDNQRKRLVRDVEMARKFANERLLGDLLPVFDSLDAGLSAAGSEASPLRDGLDLTFKQLLKVAADNGLQQIDPVGQPFNPDQHQAISRQDGSDAAPDTVVQVFQKGYLLNERLLRPALVVVAGA
jgi:molecular chaperone GrpE